jgi:hypothetical protein
MKRVGFNNWLDKIEKLELNAKCNRGYQEKQT